MAATTTVDHDDVVMMTVVRSVSPAVAFLR